jgi:hypothetical protein
MMAVAASKAAKSARSDRETRMQAARQLFET